MLALKADDRIGLAPNIALHGDAQSDFFMAFNVITGEQFRLNPTSFWVMESIMEGIEWAKLMDSFFKRFEVDREQGDQDLNSVASQLLEMGLAEIIRRQKR